MTPAGTRVVGYVRTSTDDQRNGLAAQRAAIEQAATARGWQLVTILEEHVSGGKKAADRPSLAAALALIEAGGADALVVAKLDRLSRSVIDFGRLVERAKAGRWALVVLDMDLDMTTATGEVVANILMAFAQFERRLISERTTAALGALRREGKPTGHAPTPADVVARITREHGEGKSLGAIARGLNEDGVPTAQGGAKWYPSSVRSIINRAGASA